MSECNQQVHLHKLEFSQMPLSCSQLICLPSPVTHGSTYNVALSATWAPDGSVVLLHYTNYVVGSQRHVRPPGQHLLACVLT